MSHGDDVQWLTYSELAKARGINTTSARRLTFRHKWRRQHGNDGTVRVAVPVADIEARAGGGNSHDDSHSGSPSASRSDIGRIVSGFEAAVASLTERADRAEQALAAERTRADALRDRLDGADQARRQAEEAAEALRRAEVERKARGPLRRAWDGWRGR